MERSRLEQDNIIKDVRNLFILNKLEKETNDAATKGIRNLKKKEKNTIKDRIFRDIRDLFEHEEETSKSR